MAILTWLRRGWQQNSWWVLGTLLVVPYGLVTLLLYFLHVGR